jgi:hypothetical protein
MCVERLNVVAWTDGSQVDRNAAHADCKFLGSGHEFATEASSLLFRIDAEHAEVHSVRFILKVDTADDSIAFFEQQELTGPQVFQGAFAVNALAADEWTFDFKRGVD